MSPVKICPENEIHFDGPADQRLTSFLSLTNEDSNAKIGIRMESNAPQCFSVKPKRGLIQPGSQLQIAIKLNPAVLLLQGRRPLIKVRFCVMTGNFVTMDNFDLVWEQSENFRQVQEHILQV